MLEVAKIKLDLVFTTPASLPRWMGSTFRGGFGEHLRRACCANGSSECINCDFVGDCLFYCLYERERASRGHAPPVRPVIIIPPFFGKRVELEKGSVLPVEVLLFGEFRRFLPHVVVAMQLFGRTGIGSVRRSDRNRFSVERVTSSFSGKEIYDGNIVKTTHVSTIDVRDTPPCDSGCLVIGFKTPLILKTVRYPPSPGDLLALIRSRLIFFVNEYGSQEHIAPYVCNGTVAERARHFHLLERRSRRTGARQFESYTGIAEYHLTEANEVAKWLYGVGSLLGAGPKSAFGCGFFSVLSAEELQPMCTTI